MTNKEVVVLLLFLTAMLTLGTVTFFKGATHAVDRDLDVARVEATANLIANGCTKIKYPLPDQVWVCPIPAAGGA